MTSQEPWHCQDAFWECFEPVLFSQERQARAAEEVTKLEKLLQIGKGARILDLCCGNGRHSLELAQRGYSVVGVDCTQRYIEKARAAAVRRNLDVVFELDDMRRFREPGAFDYVLNMFGSFGYFEDPADDRAVVENVYASLRSGGRFLVETMGKEIMARNFRAHDWSEEGDLLLLSERKVSQNWGRIHTRWIVLRGAERSEYEVSTRSYSAMELSALFSHCAFGELEVYGGLDGSTYDERAQRLVVIGRKVDS